MNDKQLIEKYGHHPGLIRKFFEKSYNEPVIINGPIDDRIIYFKKSQVLFSPGKPLKECGFVKKFKDCLSIDNDSIEKSFSEVPEDLVYKLEKPNVFITALYHSDNFPLPRFPLGISDIARAIREEFTAQVTLMDMQLGSTIQDLYQQILNEKYEIVCISITFGQFDLLENLLDKIKSIHNYDPLIVIGGSLASLNAKFILEKVPKAIIGTGAGESTLKGILEYWYGYKSLSEIDSIMYGVDSEPKKTRRVSPLTPTEGIPELDLLPEIFKKRGVMQLESTRGCSYACSFCPRAHKGIWTAQAFSVLDKVLLPHVDRIFKEHPEISRKIFLVDEEFVGYKRDDETTDRVFKVCNILKKYQFTFETSARVDQVYRRNRDKEWHVERIKLWKYLTENGLDRVLFGVESGVDTILKRFNKNTTKKQNQMGIRILTSCGVPIRFTYITFDPLMTMEELIESYQFQGSKTLLMKPNLDISNDALFDGIHDETYVNKNKRNVGFYRDISYQLVSMESLIGSKYLKEVEKRGLAGNHNYSMGRRDARYLDERIGMMSFNGQLWIDRNFSLDYMIKSIEKVSPDYIRPVVRGLRDIVKDFAYGLFGKMLGLVNQDLSYNKSISRYIELWDIDMINKQRNQMVLEQLMDEHFEEMIEVFESKYTEIKTTLMKPDREKMDTIINSWKQRNEWRLINAA